MSFWRLLAALSLAGCAATHAADYAGPLFDAHLHYSHDEIAEAQALYERAIALEADVFEAHFNLGNILHDLGRYPKAQACYREALRLNPGFADAHFYLAVTLEKHGQSQEARHHWRAYQQLAPQGEWVALAREFSDGGPDSAP